jgi:hypothetical protein
MIVPGCAAPKGDEAPRLGNPLGEVLAGHARLSVIFVYRGTAPLLCLTSHANRLTIRGDVKAIVKLNLMLVGP